MQGVTRFEPFLGWLSVVRKSIGDVPDFLLSQSPKVKHLRPAADVLFDSVAASHAGRVVAVVLTGNDRDGSAGIAAIKNKGGWVIVQDPATAEAPSMPISALTTGAVDQTLQLPDIPPVLVKMLGGQGDC